MRNLFRFVPLISAAVVSTGAGLAATRYPGGFDWQYMVMSALASSRHNPDGGRWFAAALAVSLLVLWPVTSRLHVELTPRRGARFGVGALRLGILFEALTGLERLLLPDASRLFDKAHELLALLCFLCLYAGVVAVCLQWRRTAGAARHVPNLLLLHFTLLGAMLIFLWLGQRELGWVGRDWRALGIPLWRSFAFWQWLACVSILGAFACFALVLPANRLGSQPVKTGANDGE
jgi:hypothetical protein